jgi:hypothetical protein
VSQSGFFAHLLLAVLPLVIAWSIGRESLPAMITKLRDVAKPNRVGRIPDAGRNTGRLNVSLAGEIIVALLAAVLGSMLAERLITRFLPAVELAAREPAAPPIFLTMIVTITTALVAYAIWWSVALFNERVRRIVPEDFQSHQGTS